MRKHKHKTHIFFRNDAGFGQLSTMKDANKVKKKILSGQPLTPSPHLSGVST